MWCLRGTTTLLPQPMPKTEGAIALPVRLEDKRYKFSFCIGSTPCALMTPSICVFCLGTFRLPLCIWVSRFPKWLRNPSLNWSQWHINVIYSPMVDSNACTTNRQTIPLPVLFCARSSVSNQTCQNLLINFVQNWPHMNHYEWQLISLWTNWNANNVKTHGSRLRIIVPSPGIMRLRTHLSMRIFTIFISSFERTRMSFSTCITHVRMQKIKLYPGIILWVNLVINMHDKQNWTPTTTTCVFATIKFAAEYPFLNFALNNNNNKKK